MMQRHFHRDQPILKSPPILSDTWKVKIKNRYKRNRSPVASIRELKYTGFYIPNN